MGANLGSGMGKLGGFGLKGVWGFWGWLWVGCGNCVFSAVDAAVT